MFGRHPLGGHTFAQEAEEGVAVGLGDGALRRGAPDDALEGAVAGVEADAVLGVDAEGDAVVGSEDPDGLAVEEAHAGDAAALELDALAGGEREQGVEEFAVAVAEQEEVSGARRGRSAHGKGARLLDEHVVGCRGPAHGQSAAHGEQRGADGLAFRRETCDALSHEVGHEDRVAGDDDHGGGALAELARSGTGPGEATDESAGLVEDAHVAVLRVEHVDRAVVADGDAGDLAELVGAVAFGGSDVDLLLDHGLHGPDGAVGVGHDGDTGAVLDGAAPAAVGGAGRRHRQHQQSEPSRQCAHGRPRCGGRRRVAMCMHASARVQSMPVRWRVRTVLASACGGGDSRAGARSIYSVAPRPWWAALSRER